MNKTKIREEFYCIYCKQSKKQIQKMSRHLGFRSSCWARGTPRGFHSYGIRKIRMVEKGKNEI